MARKKKHPEHVNHERWLVSYADFITLLFAFFVVMFAVSQVDNAKVGRFTDSVRAVTLWHGPELKTESNSSGNISPPALIPTNIAPTGQAQGVELRHVRELLRQRLRSGIINNRITIEERDSDVIVRLKDAGFFESGSDQLRADSRADLQALGNAIHDLPYSIRVDGHTDSIPVRSTRFMSNWQLSAARAAAVLEVLHHVAGVPETRFSITGWGSQQPVASNSSVEGRRQNRRVDVVLVDVGVATQPPQAFEPRTEDAQPPVPEPHGLSGETSAGVETHDAETPALGHEDPPLGHEAPTPGHTPVPGLRSQH